MTVKRSTEKKRANRPAQEPQPPSRPSAADYRWLLDEPASRVDEVYDQIFLRIVRGELPGNSELKSTQLAKLLGVSRTPVVQALGKLAADGIVAQHRNLRAVVRQGAENWLVDIHELRKLLEPAAAARAAGLIPDALLEELAAMGAGVPKANKSEWEKTAQAFDLAIHLCIADHCANVPLREAIYKCWDYKRICYKAGHDLPADVERGYREHIAILDALRDRNGDIASAAMLFHLRSAARHRPGGHQV